MNRWSALLLGTLLGLEFDLRAQPSHVSDAAPAAAKVEGGLAEVGCATEIDSRAPNAVAVVNGTIITAEDVNARVEPSLLELRERLREVREHELRLEINSRLLEAEAKSRGTTTFELIRKEVIDKVASPTEEDALAFYEENRSDLEGEFSSLKRQILLYLNQQRQSAAAKELADRLRSAVTVETLVDDVDLSEEDALTDGILARLDGETVTLGELEGNPTSQIHRIKDRIYAVKKGAIDVLVNEDLLSQEARRRNLSTDALLSAEVTSRLGPVSEMAVRQFYDRHRDLMEGIDFRTPEGREKIVQHLRQEAFVRKKAELAERLRSDATIEVYLEAPVLPPGALTTRDQPSRGPEDAPVTIVEFVDYECASCAHLHGILDELVTEYGDRIQLVARDFPLARHERAYKAAVAAEAAREQGRYWEYVKVLFENQSALTIPDLKRYARELGLDAERFDRALDTDHFADNVRLDRAEGLQLGIASTPTVFVNGRRVKGRTREAIAEAIELALSRKR